MSKLREMARRAIEGFVVLHGGNIADIWIEGQSYRWTAPDGRVASVGWEA
ncbi:hypothetical protein [Sphingobium sp.]|jgi:hypothetical protein|nr:hypothetical protein [Sphingobium sp.]